MKRHYKLLRKDARIYTDWITLIPTIEIHLNEPVYREHTFCILFSWLVVHARLFWIEEIDNG